MSSKQRLRSQLEFARNFTESLLEKFKTPEEFTHQVHPNANHALWFAGHIAQTDNFFLSIVDSSKAVEKRSLRKIIRHGFAADQRPSGLPHARRSTHLHA